MKKRSCGGALLLNILGSPKPGSSGLSPVCVACTPVCGGVTFAFSPVICNSFRCHLWTGLHSCGMSGPVWGLLGLELSQTRCSPEMQWYGTALSFPCVVLWEAFIGVWGPQSDLMSAPSPLLGPHSWAGVCVILPSQGRSLWSGAGPLPGSGNALDGPWPPTRRAGL